MTQKVLKRKSSNLNVVVRLTALTSIEICHWKSSLNEESLFLFRGLGKRLVGGEAYQEAHQVDHHGARMAPEQLPPCSRINWI